MDYNKEIDNKLSQAQALINECVEMADEHGLEFEASFIGANNTYISEKLIEKHKNNEAQIEAYSEYDEHYAGWQHSSFCF